MWLYKMEKRITKRGIFTGLFVDEIRSDSKIDLSKSYRVSLVLPGESLFQKIYSYGNLQKLLRKANTNIRSLPNLEGEKLLEIKKLVVDDIEGRSLTDIHIQDFSNKVKDYMAQENKLDIVKDEDRIRELKNEIKLLANKPAGFMDIKLPKSTNVLVTLSKEAWSSGKPEKEFSPGEKIIWYDDKNVKQTETWEKIWSDTKSLGDIEYFNYKSNKWLTRLEAQAKDLGISSVRISLRGIKMLRNDRKIQEKIQVLKDGKLIDKIVFKTEEKYSFGWFNTNIVSLDDLIKEVALFDGDLHQALWSLGLLGIEGSMPEDLIMTGYDIYVSKPEEIVNNSYKKFLMGVKVGSPAPSRKYHEISTFCVPPKSEGLCLAWTFLYLNDSSRFRKGMLPHEVQRMNIYIKDWIETKKGDLKYYLKNGYLFGLMSELAKSEYKYQYPIWEYETGTLYTFDKEGKMIILKGEGRQQYEGKPCMFWSSNQAHVSPAIYSYEEEKVFQRETERKRREKFFRSRKNPPELKDTLLISFDLETFLKGRKCNPYVTVSFCGTDPKDHSKYEPVIFYGKNCKKEYVDYMDTKVTPKNVTNGHAKGKIELYHMMSFSDYDMNLMFIEMRKRLFNLKHSTSKSGSKFTKLQYHNIIWKDMKRFFSGSLASVAKDFGIGENKMTFPYSFVTEDTLYYKGDIPDVEYWNSEDDFWTYVRDNMVDCLTNTGYEFDMEWYSKKYCMRDVELLHKIHIKLFEKMTATYNGVKVNLTKKESIHGMCFELFLQAYIDKDIILCGSPHWEKEKRMYKGGYTCVFKKHFKYNPENGWKLEYWDLNSAYAAVMMGWMPYKAVWGTDVWRDGKELNLKDINPCHSYVCEGSLEDPPKNYSSPIISETPEGKSVRCVNFPRSCQWGNSLIEYRKDGGKIIAYEECKYSEKKVFDTFCNDFYKEKSNSLRGTTDYTFAKQMLCDLYGKTAEGVFNQMFFVTSEEEFQQILSIHGHDNLLRVSDVECELPYAKSVIFKGKPTFRENENLIRYASYITNAVRMELHKAMRQIGFENIYYCDTDSLFFLNKGQNLDGLLGNEMGKFKNEFVNEKDNKLCVEAYFAAPKQYEYKYYDLNKNVDGTVTIVKGITKGSMEYGNLHLEETSFNMKTVFRRTIGACEIHKDVKKTIRPNYAGRYFIGNDSEPYRNMEDYLEAMEDLKKKNIKKRLKKEELVEKERMRREKEFGEDCQFADMDYIMEIVKNQPKKKPII